MKRKKPAPQNRPHTTLQPPTSNVHPPTSNVQPPTLLTLSGIAHGGEAIGRHAGKTVFVPYAIPGERVTVELVQEKAHWARARLLTIEAPSPDRVTPPCPYFGPEACGGCQWQHIAYARQLALKRDIVRDQLQRLGHIADPPVEEVWAVALEDQPDPAWHYRNHIQFGVTADGLPGLQRANSHDLVAVAECRLAAPPLDEVHAALWAGLTTAEDAEPDADATAAPTYKGKLWVLGEAPRAPERTTTAAAAPPRDRVTRLAIRAGLRTGDTLLALETDGDAPALSLDLPISVARLYADGTAEALVGQACLAEEIAGLRYRISAGSFFQVNSAGAEALVDRVVAFLDPQPGQRLLDAYAGVGLFALALAPLVEQVDAIEASPSACADFAWNARAQPNVTLHTGATEAVLATLHGPFDGIVVDPPRRGLEDGVVQALARLAPPRLVYVSCDPATLARDAARLRAAGFVLRTVQPIDLFPQTYHVECVSLWER